MSGLPQQVLLQAHEVYSDSDALGKRTYTQSASSPTISRTEARTISRMSASVFASTSSCSGVTHTQTAGSSVASSPTSTRHDATGVGRPCSFPSSDSILVVVFVTTSAYRTHPNAVHAPHWPRSQQLGDGGPAFIREAAVPSCAIRARPCVASELGRATWSKSHYSRWRFARDTTPCRPRLDRCRSKGSSIGGVAPREQEGPQRIGVRKSFIVVPAELWSTNSQSAKPLGRWLVDNMPRGANRGS